MTILHSFINYKNEVPYHFKEDNAIFLNFYSYLLSYILLHEKYDNITVVCNQSAHDKLIKYIPYEDVILIDTPQILEYNRFWSKVKIDTYNQVKGPFIHVDGDVFIFNDLLNNFINDDTDVIYQNIENNDQFVLYKKYNKILKEFIIENNILSQNFLHSNAVNCGVVGFKHDKHKEMYLERVNRFYELISVETDLINQLDSQFTVYLEQFILGDLITEQNLKRSEIFTINELKSNSIIRLGDVKGYSHFWGDSKYNPTNTKLFIRKIKNDFPDYYKFIVKFEKENNFRIE
jgi:Family of unknown function (DUF6734)